jgi:hypothetical protein
MPLTLLLDIEALKRFGMLFSSIFYSNKIESDDKIKHTAQHSICFICLMVFNANSAIFQLYNGENKLIFNEMMTRSALC